MEKHCLHLILVIIGLFTFSISLAQSTEDIIRNHIRAIGGDKWDQINTIVIEGIMKEEGNTIETAKRAIKGKATRVDLTMHSRDASISEKKYYIILNDDKGWKYLPGDKNNTIYVLYEAEVNRLKDDLDYESPFIHYIEKGRSIDLLGIEYYNNNEFYKFLIEYKSGKKIYCYMNSSTFLIDKTVLIDTDVEDTQVYSDYQKLPEGIIIAKKISSLQGELEITSVIINSNLQESLFKPSEKNNYNYSH